MQRIALFYYLVCLIIGISSILCISLITLKTRNGFFGRYLSFSIFYSLLIIAFLTSLYMEVNYGARFEAFRIYLKLAIFIFKCGLAYSLIVFTNHVFNIHKRNIINLIVFLILLAAVLLRLIHFFNIFPEDAESNFSFVLNTRIIIDALIILGLLYLFILRFFRLRETVPEDFRGLIKLITLVIAGFSPAIVVEIIFYTQWGFALFTPAMYCTISVVFLLALSGYFVDNYRLSKKNLNKIPDMQDPSLKSFMEKYGISKREQDIVACLLKGSTNQGISDLLFISASTVKAHIYNIFKKTGVKTRHQLFFKIINRE
jgi:DNA-binding CsgD family transcriptional regulator